MTDEWLRGDCDGPGEPDEETLDGVIELPSSEEMTRAVRKERLLQARWAYVSALVVSLLISLTGGVLLIAAVVLFLRGSIAAGALSTVGGVIIELLSNPSVSSFKLNRESNDRLSRIERALEAIERAQTSALYASRIIRPETRDDTFREISHNLNRMYKK